ncbi:hypothetical protein, partial [Pseudomonas aeruginosa]|uniref:hypothetical protein n=1 Tax=Pseudomonas aeruginosa TaxID=287 RepID=UPI0026EAF7D4
EIERSQCALNGRVMPEALQQSGRQRKSEPGAIHPLPHANPDRLAIVDPPEVHMRLLLGFIA